jgi:hypothetical protein
MYRSSKKGSREKTKIYDGKFSKYRSTISAVVIFSVEDYTVCISKR